MSSSPQNNMKYIAAGDWLEDHAVGLWFLNYVPGTKRV